METISGTRLLQLAFGFAASATRQLNPHELEFQAEARPVLDQVVRNEYSIGMLWLKLVQKIEKGEIPGAAEVWWDENLPGDVAARTARRYARTADFFHKLVFTTYGFWKLDILLQLAHLHQVRLTKAADPGAIAISFIQDGKPVTKPFKDCSFAELTLAAHPPVTHPQPQPDGSTIDPKLPEMTKQFLAVANNRLAQYMGPVEDGFLDLKVAWSGRKEAPPRYTLVNIGEDDFPNIVEILKATWAEIWDEVYKGKVPYPPYLDEGDDAGKQR